MKQIDRKKNWFALGKKDQEPGQSQKAQGNVAKKSFIKEAQQMYHVRQVSTALQVH